jgi:hypothetical protein
MLSQALQLLRNLRGAAHWYRAFVRGELPSGYCDDPHCSHTWDDHILVGDGFLDEDDDEDDDLDEIVPAYPWDPDVEPE